MFAPVSAWSARRLSTIWPQFRRPREHRNAGLWPPGAGLLGNRGRPSRGRALDGTAGRWDSDLMTQAAKKLLEEFDALQDGDRAEVLTELLRRVALTPHDLPSPDDLAAAADQLFVELDRRERSK